jgi:hypothetical protein
VTVNLTDGGLPLMSWPPDGDEGVIDARRAAGGKLD